MNNTSRPRPTLPVVVDPDNAYARLGVSPLADTDEIRKVVRARRADYERQRQSEGQQRFGAWEARIAELDQLAAAIGTPHGRAAYDADHPQNRLLAVQPSPHDFALDRLHLMSAATRFLVSHCEDASILPSAEAPALITKPGLDPELGAFLSAHHTAASPSETTK